MDRSRARSRSRSEAEAAEFADCWDSFAQAIYSYCFRLTADAALAEDLTSIVFLEAWRRRHDVEVPAAMVRAWLYGIATNVLRNQRRSMRRYARARARLEPPGVEPDFAAAVDARLDDERLMRTILSHIAELPRVERETLALCVWQGLSHAEAALALGIPEATVRTRLHRARRRLQAGGESGSSLPTALVSAHSEEGAHPV